MDNEPFLGVFRQNSPVRSGGESDQLLWMRGTAGKLAGEKGPAKAATWPESCWDGKS